MQSLEDYFSGEFWSAQGWMAPWLKQAPPAYWREMTLAIVASLKRKDRDQYVLTDAGRFFLRNQLCLRLSQASDAFVPWLEQAVPLKGARILEFGCGTGSSTAGLAHAGANVRGIDIQGKSLQLARKRLPLLGYEATFTEAAADWLSKPLDADDFRGPFDLIVCYAMLEHLLVPERLHLLSLCRDIMARDGAILAVFETPNRFAPFDWHSSKLSFLDILPDELAFEYARRNSARGDHPARRHGSVENDYQQLYRFGRGVSWHEFDIAIGMGSLEVLLDGYSPKSLGQKSYHPEPAFEDALADIFARLEPPVPKGFCRPSLELLLKLKA
ncbi:MAG: class I SAM-dependent methyltransferase [Alphaproteobacteria bacterium]|nr:class I SAM-dependent methyltransferase [Alphaproteobacteria bacterium]MBV9692301.1 class I SAM-dependent methyltransferase [Alphaproteobacteria bacterium]